MDLLRIYAPRHMRDALRYNHTITHCVICVKSQFTRALAQTTPQGVPGRKPLRFAGTIPLEDVQLMREAIEQGYEQVDTQSCSLIFHNRVGDFGKSPNYLRMNENRS
ncbi:MAG: hypothetical protein Fur0021_18180 [Candidatus Promineifilaceae bacterium]